MNRTKNSSRLGGPLSATSPPRMTRLAGADCSTFRPRRTAAVTPRSINDRQTKGGFLPGSRPTATERIDCFGAAAPQTVQRNNRLLRGRLRRLGKGRVNVGSAQSSGSGAHRFPHFPPSISRAPAAGPKSPETPTSVVGFADLKLVLRLRGMTDPRTPALSPEPSVRLRPGWRVVGILNPMDHGGPSRSGSLDVIGSFALQIAAGRVSVNFQGSPRQ